jgi:hypothetical protein
MENVKQIKVFTGELVVIVNTGVLKMVVGVLTTCHTQYT